ncbi:MAG: deoxyribose-phosphate aldolase [Deltaproteobacteria bacterium]|nr:deoxyribose-phosphate aldolase [Deltaproteobacteria bacterium]MBU48363.1 deoxyribose-phosphate aldolase [Deltaproteobacteria bacterium]
MEYRLPSIPTVDQVQVEARAASFQKRSIKKSSKRAALDLIIRMTDLTTLEGMDTPGKVRMLCQKARTPHVENPDIPSVAAVCVYPTMVSIAKEALKGTSIHVAAVATAFPSGQSFLPIRTEEVRQTVAQGADEIDMVINRGAFLSGDYNTVYNEIVAFKEACGPAHLKVILETGELHTYDQVRKASHIAMDAGADFIKTSTGKVSPAATLPVTLVMLEAIRDHYKKTGIKIGMKPAGGIRTAKLAWQYLCMVKETLGDDWLDPSMFRFGASSLLNDVLMQWQRQDTGRYQSSHYFSLD